VLRAALNRAFQHGHCSTDAAWRRVRGFRAVDEPRVRYLSEDECIRLINATDAEFRPLVRAALLTGCRWGELVSARVADYEPDSKTLRVAESKAGKVRHVPLTDEGADLLDECAAGRPGSEPLFVRADGSAWRRDYQARPMRAASKKAEIDPPVSFHLLRHAYGSLLVRAGAPLQVVSEALGHADVRMSQRHYAHLQPGFVADTVRAHLPTFTKAKPKVKALRRKARKQEAPGTAATAPGAVVHAQWGPRHEQAES
jgi:integrase